MSQSEMPRLDCIEMQLLERRKRILADIRGRLHGSGDPDKLALINHLEEVGDWVEADLLNDTDIAMLDKELSDLREVDGSLLQIKAGTYGICTDCGDTIPTARLDAIPTAKRCIACQTKADKRQDAHRGASL